MSHFSEQYDTQIRWNEIPSGTELIKFTSVDDSQKDFKITLHGFFERSGKIYITDEIIEPKESQDVRD